MNNLQRRPLEIVAACRAADLETLRLTIDGLRRFVSFGRAFVITAKDNIPRFRNALDPEVEIFDEDALIPGMTLAQLAMLPIPGFPKGAGWYFQQLVKFAFVFSNLGGDYFLIWDADTVPLRPLEFFDQSGRMLFTMAAEEHAPYFETYRRLLQEEPNREFSFISQHMIVQSSILREMLGKIEANFSGTDSWAWKIVKNLKGSHTNLFSEYETLGHYVKNHYPERAAYRKLNWLREGSLRTRGVPSRIDLEQLGQKYDFVAFESGQMPLRRFVRQIRGWLQEL